MLKHQISTSTHKHISSSRGYHEPPPLTCRLVCKQVHKQRERLLHGDPGSKHIHAVGLFKPLANTPPTCPSCPPHTPPATPHPVYFHHTHCHMNLRLHISCHVQDPARHASNWQARFQVLSGRGRGSSTQTGCNCISSIVDKGQTKGIVQTAKSLLTAKCHAAVCSVEV